MKTPTITSEILSLIAEIDRFKGLWSGHRLISPEKLDQMRHTATIQSIGSSTRIEGSKLSDAQVSQLLGNLRMQSFHSRDEQEVAGYAETLQTISGSWEEINLSENHIKQLHKELLKYTHKDKRHRGEYKKHPNDVSAFDEDGQEVGIIFETVPPFDTPQKMSELIAWGKERIRENDLHPLLIIGVFVVHFLAIHPFQDGNGRLSRILTTLLLLKFGYNFASFFSLEHLIEENKDLYYASLRKTQSHIWQKEIDYTPWLIFFLRSLKKQTALLQAKIDQEQSLDQDLSAIDAEILSFFSLAERLTLSEMVKQSGRNRNTLKKHLSSLVKKGHLTRLGKGRGVYYTRM